MADRKKLWVRMTARQKAKIKNEAKEKGLLLEEYLSQLIFKGKK